MFVEPGVSIEAIFKLPQFGRRYRISETAGGPAESTLLLVSSCPLFFGISYGLDVSRFQYSIRRNGSCQVTVGEANVLASSCAVSDIREYTTGVVPELFLFCRARLQYFPQRVARRHAFGTINRILAS